MVILAASFLFLPLFGLLRIQPVDCSKFSDGSLDLNIDINETLRQLKEGEARLRYSKTNKAIFVLGNSGAGKTTLVQFFAGDLDQLKSIGVPGDYLIQDKSGGSSGISFGSKTWIPDLVVDNETSQEIYDCPGFGDTRNASTDITISHLIKLATDDSESVKLVFVIGHSSVRKGNDPNDFNRFVKHVTSLMPDMERFKDSIALIVTKVEYLIDVRDNMPVAMITDERIIEGIADFLRDARMFYQDRQKQENLADPERNLAERVVKFIDIILTKSQNKASYPRIAIMRRPNMPGPVTSIPLLMKNRPEIRHIIFNEIGYAQTQVDDIRYSISDTSKPYARDLAIALTSQAGNQLRWMLHEISGDAIETVKKTLEQIRSNGSFIPKPHDGHKNAVLIDTILDYIKQLKVIPGSENSALSTFLNETFAQHFARAENRASKLTPKVREVVGKLKYSELFQQVGGVEMAPISHVFDRQINMTEEWINKEKTTINQLVELIAPKVAQDLEAAFEKAANEVLRRYKSTQMSKNSIQKAAVVMKKLYDELAHLATPPLAIYAAFKYQMHMLSIGVRLSSQWLDQVQSAETKLFFMMQLVPSLKVWDPKFPVKVAQELSHDLSDLASKFNH